MLDLNRWTREHDGRKLESLTVPKGCTTQLPDALFKKALPTGGQLSRERWAPSSWKSIKHTARSGRKQGSWVCHDPITSPNYRVLDGVDGQYLSCIEKRGKKGVDRFNLGSGHAVVLTNLPHNRSPACHGFGTENNKNQVLFGRRRYIKAALAVLFVRPHRVTVLCQ
jgi:hypothetical protein